MTCGWLALALHWTFASTLILSFSGLLLVHSWDFSGNVPRRKGIFLLVFFAAVLPIVWVTARFGLERQVLEMVSHPAFVIPMWLLMLPVEIRRWRHDRQTPVA